MLDVEVHPQYARNGWIYLAYTEVVARIRGAAAAAGRACAGPPAAAAGARAGDAAGRRARRR